MSNPNIIEYWKKIFDLAKRNELEEYELVHTMLAYHGKEATAENQTRCLGKIFKDVYRGYLLFENNGKKMYKINKIREVE